MGKRTKRHQSTSTTKIVQEDVLAHEKCIPAEIISSISNNKTLDEFGKILWMSEKTANLTESHPRNNHL